MYQALLFAVLALALGNFLRKRIRLLNTFCIPAPVVGGFIFAIVFSVLHSMNIADITFDETLRTACMVLFFTCVGFQANLKVIKEGGADLIKFIALTAVIITLQCAVSIGLAIGIGVSPLVGMCTGAIPMVGGLGNAAAFGPMLEEMGCEGATTLASAAATYGLIAGSLIGGPIAYRLIKKKDLLKTAVPVEPLKLRETVTEAKTTKDLRSYVPASFQVAIAAGLGTIVTELLNNAGMTFAIYIGPLIISAVIRNIAEFSGMFEVHMDEINDMSDIFLNFFLGIAMITLQIWQIANLALPLIILLIGQTVLMYFFATFVVFNVMGRNYDSAVMCAGMCGFGMGQTPNALANMQTIQNKYAPSVKAFLIVPLVGTLFADLMLSIIVSLFLNVL